MPPARIQDHVRQLIEEAYEPLLREHASRERLATTRQTLFELLSPEGITLKQIDAIRAHLTMRLQREVATASQGSDTGTPAATPTNAPATGEAPLSSLQPQNASSPTSPEEVGPDVIIDAPHTAERPAENAPPATAINTGGLEYENPIKAVWREWLRNSLAKGLTPAELHDSDVLCLGGAQCSEIRDVYLPLGVQSHRIVTVEGGSPERRQTAKVFADRYGVELVVGDVLRYLRNTDRRFRIISLDMEGAWCEEYRNILEALQVDPSKVAVCMNVRARRDPQSGKALLQATDNRRRVTLAAVEDVMSGNLGLSSSFVNEMHHSDLLPVDTQTPLQERREENLGLLVHESMWRPLQAPITPEMQKAIDFFASPEGAFLSEEIYISVTNCMAQHGITRQKASSIGVAMQLTPTQGMGSAYTPLALEEAVYQSSIDHSYFLSELIVYGHQLDRRMQALGKFVLGLPAAVQARGGRIQDIREEELTCQIRNRKGYILVPGTPVQASDTLELCWNGSIVSSLPIKSMEQGNSVAIMDQLMGHTRRERTELALPE